MDDLKPIATEVLGWLKDGREFIGEQAPLLAQEVVRYGVISNAIGLVLGVGLGIGAAYMLRACARVPRDHWGDRPDSAIIGMAASVILGVVGLVAIIVSTDATCQAIFAPRLYILNKLAELVK